MRAALPDHKALNGCAAAWAWQAGAAEDPELITVAPRAGGHTVEVGLAGTETGAQVAQAALQYKGYGLGQSCQRGPR